MIEMIKSGTTCFSDFYYYSDEVGRATEEIGMRGSLGCAILDVPTFYYKTTDEAFKLAQDVIDKFKNHSLIKVSLAPHMFQTTSLDTYIRAKKLADKNNLFLTTHTSETKLEVNFSLKKYKKRPIEILDKAGILDERTFLAHCCWLDKKEIKY